ncbi:type III-B CRISPR module RAMP protein Cmr6 [Endozoicomonas euniceicola]|uniref:Type III-B CRISPR module RAMP protein Cmr6 n=1 Tax=Endozoicomonas euniceicola TaxID=1234143 RepID=A0ABY6GSB8_9GAMM|nr:type III-B CRISPR module RAMP protein Cmr6 [Endozoicomonas euniceicola]UYM15657.1 type III-B CRISPR module RAMP protein Cmr6 [Endozoicomonas euniceicola]
MLELPLYQKAHCDKPVESFHKGLWFERFFSYPEKWSVGEKHKSHKADWVRSVSGSCGDSTAIEKFSQRLVRLINHLQGQYQVYELDWHFVTGMGNPHPVENGFLWHPTLGTPYLQGASVKGLLRSWMEQQGADPETLHLWFGSESKEPAHQNNDNKNNDNKTGALVFHDVIPVDRPKLGADIMTPHMGKWYEKGGSDHPADNPETVPADWHSPVPVSFLVTREARFLFAISPRTAAMAEVMDTVMAELENALEWLGAGSKTSVGYGAMQRKETAEKDFAETLTEQQKQEEESRKKSSLSEAGLALYELEKQLQKDIERNHKEAGGDCKKQLNSIVKQAEGNPWAKDELESLVELAKKVLSHHGPGPKKGKGKELMVKIRTLLEKAN